MGKEWYWSKSHRKESSDVSDTSEKNTTQVVGCMSSIFHLFDLHQLLFTTRSTSTGGPSSSATGVVDATTSYPCQRPTKGVEAPRNSLELDVITSTSTTTKLFTSTPIKLDDQDVYEIPFAIQILPKRRETLEEQMEEESNSQATSSARSTTPSKGNVVAKLMGLETLPFSPRTHSFDEQAFLSPPVTGNRKKHQYNRKKKNRGQEQQEMGVMGRRVASSQSPSPRCPLQPKNCNSMVEDDVRRGTRSLPETPRASFARRSWDCDPRLSLQSNVTMTNSYSNSNKENTMNGRGNLSDLAMEELKCVFHDYSGTAAKTKMRSTQANVSDEQRSSPSNYAREIVRQMKDSVSRRIEKGRSTRPSSESPTTTPRSSILTVTKQSSPRSIRVIEVAEQKQVPSPREKPTLKTKQLQVESSSPVLVQPPPQKCRKISCDRFNERLKKPPANVATCVISSSNSTSSTPKPPKRPSKKGIPPPPSSVTDVKREKQQSSSLSSSQPALQRPTPVPEEFDYVKLVLQKGGIRSHTSLPFAVRWNSPSHPLDPIIFHQIELTSIATDSGPLRHRCNRKLLFDLINEILADILYPYLLENPHRRGSLKAAIPTRRDPLNGESLLNRVWLKIRNYPQAKCEVIQDIDALVESDLPDPNIRELLKHPAVVDQSENITIEIQRLIIDHILETAAADTINEVMT